MGTNWYEHFLSIYLDNLLEEARVVFPVLMSSLLVEDFICMSSLSFYFSDTIKV